MNPREKLLSIQREKSARFKYDRKPLARRTETDLKHAIETVLQARGYWCWVINCGEIRGTFGHVRLMPPGAGDIMGILPGGRAWFIECKKPGEAQNKNEIDWQHTCKLNGTPYCVCETIDEAAQFLTHINCAKDSHCENS